MKTQRQKSKPAAQTTLPTVTEHVGEQITLPPSTLEKIDQKLKKELEPCPCCRQSPCIGKCKNGMRCGLCMPSITRKAWRKLYGGPKE